MSDRVYKFAKINNDQVHVSLKYIDKAQAASLIRQGGNVMSDSRKKAEKLSTFLSNGQSVWRDQAHRLGGYKHFHDGKHKYKGHIFYGQPVFS